MIKIYTVEEAQRSILRRQPLNAMTYPPAVLAGTERWLAAR